MIFSTSFESIEVNELSEDLDKDGVVLPCLPQCLMDMCMVNLEKKFLGGSCPIII